MDLQTKKKQEQELREQLYILPEWTSAKVIATTLSMSFELDTQPLIIHAQHKGKEVVVPRVIGKRQMEFVRLTEQTQFHESSFGVLEPLGDDVVGLYQIDLMVVPGVAFTSSGKRLGFGGGFYDTCLAKFNHQTVSLALRPQIASEDAWETQPYDQSVDRVLTVGDQE
ncbi:MAG TPA: 5-formyltetrahydrofolate cyclo-ligase [Candidatus Limosilactobacillus merdipullorum]|uniref:5-formyltetrahydrofolate cyclo-ligase n=1 Tax=Candidatus Limosilactobacillus merdipullorum TaxID=2838653 RepID=A0A9D1QNR2_9LACO|nr:5-formyltetrahydrofolate cyclo-ligase [Candidatus Limosilactobacillus merdipullorum]